MTSQTTTTATHADCPAGSGADTIVLLAASVQTLTASDNATLGAVGVPVISSVMTIQGNGSTIRRNPLDPDRFRLVAINGSGDLTLQATTLSGGETADFPDDRGGGIYNSSGQLRQGTSLTPDALQGRIEYVVSGQAAPFSSFEEVRAFMEWILTQQEEKPP